MAEGQKSDKPGKTRTQSQPVPPLIANVVESPVAAQTKPSTAATIDEGTLKKIRECYARANHSSANRFERETALILAARFMKAHNIKQADLFANATTSEERRDFAGEAEVRITRSDGSQLTAIHFEKWFDRVAWAMTIFFDCNYMRSHCSCYRCVYLQYTFYGVLENVRLAAEGFAVAFNSGFNLSVRQSLSKKDYTLGFGDGLVALAYKHRQDEEDGARKQTEEATKAEAKEKMRKAQQHIEDERNRRKEMLQLQGLLPTPPEEEKELVREPEADEAKVNNGYQAPTVEDSVDADVLKDNRDFKVEHADTPRQSPIQSHMSADDDSSDDDSDFGDDDNKFMHEVKPEQGPEAEKAREQEYEEMLRKMEAEKTQAQKEAEAKQIEKDKLEFQTVMDDVNEAADRQESATAGESVEWQNHSQLVRFRQDAEQIAEEYAKKYKLKASRRSTMKVSNQEAYKQGKKAGKEHDVKRKRIEGGMGESDEKSVGKKVKSLAFE